MTLSLYGIAWRNFNIIYDSIESIISTASEPIEINIASPNDDLPNSGTDKIREYLRDQVKLGRIKRSLEFEVNTIGWGLVQMMKDFPPEEDIFFMTDIDLIVPEGADWIGLSKKHHAEGRCLTGFDLSLENYKPPNHGFSQEDCNFGVWMMCLNTEFFYRYHTTDRNTIDSGLMGLARNHGGGLKIKDIQLLHATWSIFYEGDRYYDKEYADYKRAMASNWVFSPKPQNMNYELIENNG